MLARAGVEFAVAVNEFGDVGMGKASWILTLTITGEDASMIIAPKSTAALLKAVRAARANPYIMFNVPGQFPISADDVIRMFRNGLMARCNRGMPSVEGRYDIEDWRHDQRVIQDAHRRIRRSGRNILRIPALKARYPHIDNYTI